MPDIDIAAPAAGNESSIPPSSIDVSAQPDLPPSGGLTGAGTGNFKKPTEAEIVASFNAPKPDAGKPAVANDVKTGGLPVTEVVEEPVVQTDEELAAQAAKEELEAEQAEAITPEEDISVAKINQYIREIPELKQAFDKNPGVRNSFYAMARRSSKLTEYQSIMPSPEAAKFAAANSEAMVQLNDAFFSEDPQENVGFWSNLWENSLLKDPQTGAVIKDAHGNAISTGAYERVTGAYRQALYSDLTGVIDRIGNVEEQQKAKDALALIGQMTGDFKPQSSQQVQLPQDVQQRLAKADQLEQQVKTQQSQAQQEFGSQTVQAIVSTITDDVTGHVKRMVETQSIALTAYEQKNVVNDIFKELDKLALDNRQYQMHFDSLSKRAPLTEAGRKSLIAEARKFAKDHLPSVALKVIREATSSTVEKAATKDVKRADQALKKEPKTSGNAPLSGNSSLSIKEKAAAMRSQLKRPLTQEEILAL